MLRRLVIAAILMADTAVEANAEAPPVNSTQVLPTERAIRGELPSPQKSQVAAIDFDLFVLSAYWWPGHCRASQNIPRCDPRAMPPQWRQQLVVHGLWSSYSNNFRVKKDLDGDVQPDGAVLPCNCKPYNAALAPKTPADQLIFPGQGVSNRHHNFYQYQYGKHGICSQIEQANYFAKAVQLGREANTKFPQPLPATMTVEALEHKLGPYAQLTCRRENNVLELWFVNYYCARKLRLYHPGRAIDPTCRVPECSVKETLQHILWSCPTARQVWTKLSEVWGTAMTEDRLRQRIFERQAPPLSPLTIREYEHWFGLPPVEWDHFIRALWKALVTTSAYNLWLDRNQRIFRGHTQAPDAAAAAILQRVRAHLEGVSAAWLLRHSTQTYGLLLNRLLPIMFQNQVRPHRAPDHFFTLASITQRASRGGLAWWVILLRDDQVARLGWVQSTPGTHPDTLLYDALMIGVGQLRKIFTTPSTIQVTSTSPRIVGQLRTSYPRRQRGHRKRAQTLQDLLRPFAYEVTHHPATDFPLLDRMQAILSWEQLSTTHRHAISQALRPQSDTSDPTTSPLLEEH